MEETTSAALKFVFPKALIQKQHDKKVERAEKRKRKSTQAASAVTNRNEDDVFASPKGRVSAAAKNSKKHKRQISKTIPSNASCCGGASSASVEGKIHHKRGTTPTSASAPVVEAFTWSSRFSSIEIADSAVDSLVVAATPATTNSVRNHQLGKNDWCAYFYTDPTVVTVSPQSGQKREYCPLSPQDWRNQSLAPVHRCESYIGLSSASPDDGYCLNVAVGGCVECKSPVHYCIECVDHATHESRELSLMEQQQVDDFVWAMTDSLN